MTREMISVQERINRCHPLFWIKALIWLAVGITIGTAVGLIASSSANWLGDKGGNASVVAGFFLFGLALIMTVLQIEATTGIKKAIGCLIIWLQSAEIEEDC